MMDPTNIHNSPDGQRGVEIERGKSSGALRLPATCPMDIEN